MSTGLYSRNYSTPVKTGRTQPIVIRETSIPGFMGQKGQKWQVFLVKWCGYFKIHFLQNSSLFPWVYDIFVTIFSLFHAVTVCRQLCPLSALYPFRHPRWIFLVMTPFILLYSELVIYDLKEKWKVLSLRAPKPSYVALKEAWPFVTIGYVVTLKRDLRTLTYAMQKEWWQPHLCCQNSTLTQGLCSSSTLVHLKIMWGRACPWLPGRWH